MTILLSDPRVRAVPVVECGDLVVRLPGTMSPEGARVRSGLAERLMAADLTLPAGVRLRVVEGHRTLDAQQAIITSYAAQVRRAHPAAAGTELERLTSRFVSPLDVAPHVAGAAVDLTLVDVCGDDLDLGRRSTRRRRNATGGAGSPPTSLAPMPGRTATCCGGC
jgi:D-alanyl-D-alanine dipeptidase